MARIVFMGCQLCGRKFLKDAERNSQKYCSFECRFWAKVSKKSEQECWPWQGAITSVGYGILILLPDVWVLAHRASYAMTHGSAAEGSNICHRCDNRCCVNPDHLFEGSPKDNSMDMAKKFRGRAKLTADQVRQLRRMHTEGVPYRRIANHFHLASTTVHKIATRRSYTHVN
jgi:hypothetical protein